MSNPFARISSWSARHPWLAIAMTLVAVGGLGAGMSQAEEGRISGAFTPDDLPALAVQREIESIWGETEGTFFLYLSDAPGEPNLLRAVARDMAALQSVDGIIEVAALTTVLEARIGDLDDASDAEIRAAVQQLAGTPAARPFLAEDALLARITLEPVANIPATIEDLDTVAAASDADATVVPAGRIYIEDYQAKNAGGDVAFLMPLSLVVVLVLLGVLFRRAQDVAVPVLTVLLSIVMAYGTVAWAGMALAPPSFIVMPLLLGLGIDYMLHIVYAYREEPHGKVATRFEAASKHVGFPVFFTAATTLIGFGSFLASNIPQIRTWGLLIGSGALYAFLLGFVFLPAMYRLRRKKPRKVRLPLGAAMDRITDVIMGNRRKVLAAVILATLGLGTAASFVTIENDIDFKPDDDVPSVVAMTQVQDRFGGQNILMFLVNAGDRDDLEAFEDALEDHELTGFVDGPIHRLRRAGNPDGPLVGPATDGVATDDHWLVSVGYRYDDREAAFEAVEAIAIASPLNAGLTGVDVMERESQAVFLSSLLRSTLIALVLVIILLLVIFRAPLISLLAFAPLVVTITWQLGIQTLTGIPINPITGVMTAMILGVGVDYSLHIMAHFQESKRAGRSSFQAADAAMRSVGRPVLAASITTVFAFSVLGFSSMIPLRQFGIVAAIVVTCAFVVSLTMLPVLASYLPDGNRASRRSEVKAPKPMGGVAARSPKAAPMKAGKPSKLSGSKMSDYDRAAEFADGLHWTDSR